MLKNRVRQSIKKSLKTFINILPIVIGMLLLTSLLIKLLPEHISAGLFSRYDFFNVLLSASIGSVATGHPLASYILGGELLAKGISLLAVTALIISWVTVGIVQLPAEAILLGRRFAIYRNLISFLFALVIPYFIVHTLLLIR